MICMICGKNYRSVGVHIRHKHNVSPEDYREEFGLLRTFALVDQDVSDTIGRKQKEHFASLDDDEKNEIRRRCVENAGANYGDTLSDAGKKLLAERNSVRNENYLRTQSASVAIVLEESKTLISVRRAIGSGGVAVKKMAAAGLVHYDKQLAKIEGDKNRSESIERRRAPLIASAKKLLSSGLSLRRISKITGVGASTIKRWNAAGFLAD